MTEELKTLKDLGNYNQILCNYDYDYGYDNGQGSMKEDIQTEAIKWINWLDNCDPFDDKTFETIGFISDDSAWIIGSIGILKKIFNITDEDLK